MPIEHLVSGVGEIAIDGLSSGIADRTKGLAASGLIGAGVGVLMPATSSNTAAALFSGAMGSLVPWFENKPLNAKSIAFSAVTSAALGVIGHAMKKSYVNAEKERKATPPGLPPRGR
jgi:hypothetical protein